MKSLWTITALIGFVLLSVFGVVLMPYDGSNHDVNCLASLINNSESPCPKDDPFGFANFHGSAVQKILNLIPINSISAVYFILIIGLIFYGMITVKSVLGNAGQSAFVSMFGHDAGHRSIRSKDLLWFTLHENSPSFALGCKASC